MRSAEELQLTSALWILTSFATTCQLIPASPLECVCVCVCVCVKLSQMYILHLYESYSFIFYFFKELSLTGD